MLVLVSRSFQLYYVVNVHASPIKHNSRFATHHFYYTHTHTVSWYKLKIQITPAPPREHTKTLKQKRLERTYFSKNKKKNSLLNLKQLKEKMKGNKK